MAGAHENSAKRMETRDNLPADKALEIVKQRYQENKKLYKDLYNFDFGENLSIFDKIIDTDGQDAAHVLEVAKTIVRERL